MARGLRGSAAKEDDEPSTPQEDLEAQKGLDYYKLGIGKLPSRDQTRIRAGIDAFARGRGHQNVAKWSAYRPLYLD